MYLCAEWVRVLVLSKLLCVVSSLSLNKRLPLCQTNLNVKPFNRLLLPLTHPKTHILFFLSVPATGAPFPGEGTHRILASSGQADSLRKPCYPSNVSCNHPPYKRKWSPEFILIWSHYSMWLLLLLATGCSASRDSWPEHSSWGRGRAHRGCVCVCVYGLRIFVCGCDLYVYVRER